MQPTDWIWIAAAAVAKGQSNAISRQEGLVAGAVLEGDLVPDIVLS